MDINAKLLMDIFLFNNNIMELEKRINKGDDVFFEMRRASKKYQELTEQLYEEMTKNKEAA